MPVATNKQYDKWRGDFDLTEPVERELDGDTRELVRRLADRPENRASQRTFDGYTLLWFAQRSAVFAMRERSAERIVDGVMAVAMIDSSNVDFRDVTGPLRALRCAAQAIGADVDSAFEKGASLADPKQRTSFEALRKRPENEDWCRFSGVAIVQTKSGPGFVARGFKPYRPTCRLDEAGVAFARLVEGDRYQSSQIMRESEIQPFWLSGTGDWTLKRVLQRVVATVTVSADLRPGNGADWLHQHLLIMVAELEDERAARSILTLAVKKQRRRNNFEMFAVGEGRLFCLFTGRCVLFGGTNYETRESILRFIPGAAEILKAAAQSRDS